MKRIQLFILFLLLTGAVSAQGFFGTMRKPTHTINRVGANRTAVVAADTIVNEIRPIVNIASYLIGSNENALLNGGGVSYGHHKYNSVTGRWQTVWSINALAWGKVVVANRDNSPSFLYGVAVGILNNLVMVGFATDGNKGYATAGFGINFNN